MLNNIKGLKLVVLFLLLYSVGTTVYVMQNILSSTSVSSELIAQFNAQIAKFNAQISQQNIQINALQKDSEDLKAIRALMEEEREREEKEREKKEREEEKVKRIIAIMQQIKEIEQALDIYRLHNGFYPSTEQGLEALLTKPTTNPQPKKYVEGGYIKIFPLDPWGNPFIYRNSGDNGHIDIISCGPDGIEGGGDDITNNDP